MASNREERLQMRQRGAGTRRIKEVDFGFSFGLAPPPADSLQTASQSADVDIAIPPAPLPAASETTQPGAVSPDRKPSSPRNSGPPQRTPGSARNALPERPSTFDIPEDDAPDLGRGSKRRKIELPSPTPRASIDRDGAQPESQGSPTGAQPSAPLPSEPVQPGDKPEPLPPPGIPQEEQREQAPEPTVVAPDGPVAEESTLGDENAERNNEKPESPKAQQEQPETNGTPSPSETAKGKRKRASSADQHPHQSVEEPPALEPETADESTHRQASRGLSNEDRHDTPMTSVDAEHPKPETGKRQRGRPRTSADSFSATDQEKAQSEALSARSTPVDGAETQEPETKRLRGKGAKKQAQVPVTNEPPDEPPMEVDNAPDKEDTTAMETTRPLRRRSNEETQEERDEPPTKKVALSPEGAEASQKPEGKRRGRKRSKQEENPEASAEPEPEPEAEAEAEPSLPSRSTRGRPGSKEGTKTAQAEEPAPKESEPEGPEEAEPSRRGRSRLKDKKSTRSPETAGEPEPEGQEPEPSPGARRGRGRPAASKDKPTESVETAKEPEPRQSPVPRRIRGRPAVSKDKPTESIEASEEPEPEPEPSAGARRGRGQPTVSKDKKPTKSIETAEEPEPEPEPEPSPGPRRIRGRPAVSKGKKPTESVEETAEPEPEPSPGARRGRGRSGVAKGKKPIESVEETAEPEAAETERRPRRGRPSLSKKDKQPAQPEEPEPEAEPEEAPKKSEPSASGRGRGRQPGSKKDKKPAQPEETQPEETVEEAAAERDEGEASRARRKPRQPRGETVPVTVHRLANVASLSGIRADASSGEDESADELSTRQKTKLPSRGGVNVADVLGQICRETLEKSLTTLMNGIANEGNAARRSELTTKRKAVEAYGTELEGRLFELGEMLDSNFMLGVKMKKAKREMLDMRSRLYHLRSERESVALQMDAVRKKHADEERTRQTHTDINNSLHSLELALERQTRPDTDDTDDPASTAGLEFMLRSVAETVSSSAPGAQGGLLNQIKAFNAQLETAARRLES
ncbi:hypothetical protein BDV25DRAFT_156473 [Aspergillus avenaceus]|uniref:Inner kinetochore subunit AME1 domain-containing protein n=1 Tax=Aspergillus avenaceus TaxID=36643 RepID=A0A5N6TSP0_ASPAV|nr:hypothetical protein BDV25DRAFT_156473 [Aspergillus avenaceus]